jgi:hypothetical protein
MTTTLSRALGTFLGTYGGNEYRRHTVEEMVAVLEGLVGILNLNGPEKVMGVKLIKNAKSAKTPEKLVFKVSEYMLKLEGMGTTDERSVHTDDDGRRGRNKEGGGVSLRRREDGGQLPEED